MSGVAKDDNNPTPPADEAVTAVGAAEEGRIEAPAPASTQPAASAEADAPRSRRNAPHLRVVSDNDPEFVATEAEAPQRSIGEEIRAARENAGYSLEQVSRETKVHLSHLRAIEEMRPTQLGAPVYAKGYIRAYARFLGLDEQTTLDRYLSERGAILKDPEKPEIAPPATSKSRRLPVAVPVLGILVVVLAGAGIALVVANGGDKQATKPAAAVASGQTPGAAESAAVTAAAPALQIVALKRAMLEIRSSKGDKYVHRIYEVGEKFQVRQGAGFTVTVEDGTAFEYTLGGQSLGLMQAEGGPVFSQNVDIVAQRQPVAAALPPQSADPAAAAYPAGTSATSTAPAANGAAPAPAKPRPKPVVPPATTTVTPPATNVATPPAKPATPPKHDPALDAYPDQVQPPG